MPKRQNAKDGNNPVKLPLSFFACPNGDCADFNRFDAGNLSVAEWERPTLMNTVNLWAVQEVQHEISSSAQTLP